MKHYCGSSSLLAITLVLFGNMAYSQPIGEEITLIDDTPTFEEAEVTAITPDGPVILARTNGEDREPKVSVLNNDTTSVFWVNRNGSHHVSGVDESGVRLFNIIDEDTATDIIVGINTGANTNWTLNKADRVGSGFMAAATYKFGTLSGSDAEVPDTVVDADGIHGDDGQGHGFFKLFNGDLEPTTPDPISISQFSAGHREWDCCWLSDGKLVIGTVARDHRYEADPDFPTGGNRVATINIFNPDGTRFKDEFFVSEDLTGQQEDVRLAPLSNGFVAIYWDNKSLIGGPSLHKGILFDNDGNRIKEFIATDEENGINVSWLDGGNTNQFVTIHQVNAPAGIGLPEDLIGFPVMLGQLWNDQGERIGPYILVSQHADGRGLGRPRCAMASNGSFAFSWDDDLADDVQFTTSVVGRIFNSNGTPATDAFVVHPLPEFEETAGGDPGEPICAMNNDYVAFSWASRAVPEGAARDIVVMTFQNPATGTATEDWFIY